MRFQKISNLEPTQEINLELNDNTQMIEPILETLEPILETLEPILETLEPILADKEIVIEATEIVIQMIEPILETLEPILATLEPPILATLEPILATLEPILETLEPILATLEPILETLEPILATLEPILATLEPPILALLEPILELEVDIILSTRIAIDTYVKTLLCNECINLSNIISITHSLIHFIENYKTLSGIQKTELVLEVIRNSINTNNTQDLDLIALSYRTTLLTIVNITLPQVITTLVSALNGNGRFSSKSIISKIVNWFTNIKWFSNLNFFKSCNQN